VEQIEGKAALSRRAFVGKLAAGAAVACVAAAGTAEAMVPRQKAAALPGGDGSQVGRETPKSPSAEPQVASHASEPVLAPPPWELLRPLAMGSLVAHGWRVADLSEVANGSFVLTLQNERGRSHRIHLCRNDGRPQGLVYTEQLDLVVMNGGQGDLPTEEGLAQAVAEVAHVIAGNERDRRHRALVTALLPQAERVQRFAAAARLR
jgi:hypothetical protein